MASCEGKCGVEVEEINLSFLKTDIKCEDVTEEEVITATAMHGVVTPIQKNTFEIEGTTLLTPKPEIKSEEHISQATSSPSHVPGVEKVNTFTASSGKCPGCRAPFILNLSGFNDIARHIFYSHKKNYRQYLFMLRMVYGSPYCFAGDPKRIKGFKVPALIQNTKWCRSEMERF